MTKAKADSQVNGRTVSRLDESAAIPAFATTLTPSYRLTGLAQLPTPTWTISAGRPLDGVTVARFDRSTSVLTHRRSQTHLHHQPVARAFRGKDVSVRSINSLRAYRRGDVPSNRKWSLPKVNMPRLRSPDPLTAQCWHVLTSAQSTRHRRARVPALDGSILPYSNFLHLCGFYRH